MTFRKINVNGETELKYLYDNSALTWEGISSDDENLTQVAEWLEQYRALTKNEAEFYITKGKVMNECYELAGKNAYPDELTIVSVSPECIDLRKVIFPRFEVGGRWFDDIVDNNNLSKEE